MNKSDMLKRRFPEKMRSGTTTGVLLEILRTLKPHVMIVFNFPNTVGDSHIQRMSKKAAIKKLTKRTSILPIVCYHMAPNVMYIRLWELMPINRDKLCDKGVFP